MYDNGFFYIEDNAPNVDVKCRIHEVWTVDPPEGLGRNPTMSKTLTPTVYAETRADPQRSWCLLSAWMVWRARHAGWDANAGWQQRAINDEADRLEAMIRRLQPQADRLLGDVAATEQLIKWAPDIAARFT